MMNDIIKRNSAPTLITALHDMPVVFLAGARQTGKSTLVQHICDGGGGATYYTMDDLDVLTAAKRNPKGFIDGLPEKVIIDEVQRVPELFLPIKVQVDRRRSPGRFLLTGSANVMVLPRLSESLAGRVEVITLYPFSQGELYNKKETFIDVLFSGTIANKKFGTLSEHDLWHTMVVGGYPEAVKRSDPERRNAWFKSYITTLIQRDIRELSRIEGLLHIPNLISILAERCGQLLNFADLTRSLQIPQTSLKRYFSLLESIFLIHRIQPWHATISARMVKSPKIYLNDTGLLIYLSGMDEDRLKDNRIIAGHIFENFVVIELIKQISWSTTSPSLYHYRSHTGVEVDVILENMRKECVGIEIKASANLSAKDIQCLRLVREAMGKKFIQGIVLYTGTSIIPFEENIHAVPINALWEL